MNNDKVIRTAEEKTRLWLIWRLMIYRCHYAENSVASYYYRERGIRVCDEWKNDFKAFKKWSLENGFREEYIGRKNSSSIDRIDPDGNYEPSNCQWITRSENCSRARHTGKRNIATEPVVLQVIKPNGVPLKPTSKRTWLGEFRYEDRMHQKYGDGTIIKVSSEDGKLLYEYNSKDYYAKCLGKHRLSMGLIQGRGLCDGSKLASGEQAKSNAVRA